MSPDNPRGEAEGGEFRDTLLSGIMRYRNELALVVSSLSAGGFIMHEAWNSHHHQTPFMTEFHDYQLLFLAIIFGMVPGGLIYFILNELAEKNEKLKSAIQGLQEAQEKIKKESAWFQNVLNLLSGGVLYRNAQGDYEYINAEARKIFGIPEDMDVRGVNLVSILPENVVQVAEVGDAHALGVHEQVTDTVSMNIGGQEGMFRVERTPQYNEKGEYVGMLIEIYDIDDLHRMGYVDELTGKANRRAFMDFFQNIILMMRRLNYGHNSTETIGPDELTPPPNHESPTTAYSVFMIIDIDYFKMINDILGHKIGDDLLVLVTDVIQKNIRETDKVGRIGGDEIGVVLTNVQCSEDAMRRAQSFISNLKKMLEEKIPEPYNRFTGISVGVCDFDGKENRVEIMTKADRALYVAKSLRNEQIPLKYEGGNVVRHSE